MISKPSVDCVQTWPPGPLQAASLAILLLLLCPMAILIGQESWKLLAGFAVIALIFFSFLIPPDFLLFSALLVSLGASMPLGGAGDAFSQLRWFMLLAFAVGLMMRSMVSNVESAWHPIYFCLAFFVVHAGVSSSYSPNWIMTLLKAMAFACLLIGAVLYGRLEPPFEGGYRCKFLDCLYWLAALVAVGCILSIIHVLPPQPGYFEGPFGNPNSLGAFLPLVAPVVLLKFSQSFERSPLERVINVALLIVLFASLLMSRSRAGILATFTGCGWWLYFSYRKMFGFFLGGVVLFAITLWTYFPQYVKSLNQVYVKKNSNYVLETREELLRTSWEAAMGSPFIGVGFGVSKGYSEDWKPGFHTGNAGREKGNSFLALVEEVGLVGFTFLMLPLNWCVFKCSHKLILLRRLHLLGTDFSTTLTVSACLVGGLANAFSEAWLTAAGFFSCVVFWMAFGLLAAPLSTPTSNSSSP